MRDLVVDVLNCIRCYSPDAVNLILGTIAQESAFGRYRRQLGNGPALGICQMEPNTFEDIVDNFLRYHRDLSDRIKSCAHVDHLDAMDIEHNDRLAIAMARMQYWRYPDRIPANIEGYAALWKKRYNTVYGAGTINEFVKNYHRYVLND